MCDVLYSNSTMKSLKTLVLLIFVYSLSHANPDTLWDYGEPSANEQYYVFQLNEGRTNPSVVPDRHKRMYDEGYYGLYGDEAVIADLRSKYANISPRPPLVWSAKLSELAKSRLVELSSVTPFDGFHVENVKNSTSSVYGHPYYLFSDWVKYPKTLSYSLFDFYNSRGFSFLGTSFEQTFDTGTGDYRSEDSIHSFVGVDQYVFNNEGSRIFNHILATAEEYPDLPYGNKTIWVTGIAYRDYNGSGRYEPGEGVGGVLITPNRGEYKAETASAGGYAIPFSKDDVGALTIEAMIVGEWNESYTVNLETYSSRVGDGGLLLNIELPVDPNPPSVVGGMRVSGWLEGDDTIMAKFVVAGGPGRKKTLIRGIRTNDGFSGSMSFDFEVHLKTFDVLGNELSMENTWKNGGGRTASYWWDLRNLTHAPSLSNDIMALELEPGVYTVELSVGQGSGGVLLEIFDGDSLTGSDDESDHVMIPNDERFTRISSIEFSGKVMSSETSSINNVVVDGAHSSAPVAPSSINATRRDGSMVALTWNNNGNAEGGVLVERRLEGESAWLPVGVAEATMTVFLDEHANESNGGYEYRLSAVNSAGSSVSSVVGVGSTESKMINLSTRGSLRTGHSSLIMGFTADGTGDINILSRTVGPSLGVSSSSGLYSVNPRSSIYLAGGDSLPLDSNDDWHTQDSQRIRDLSESFGATPLVAGGLDSAMYMELVSNNGYTVVSQGLVDDDGIALVEVFHADNENSPSRLVNLSTRGHVGLESENELLVGGFVIEGTTSMKVLVRGAGPSMYFRNEEAFLNAVLPGDRVAEQAANAALSNDELIAKYGILSNPQLRLLKRSTSGSTVAWTEVAANLDWESVSRNAIESAVAEVGAFEFTDSNDAAILVDLEPGVYSIHLSGEQDLTGIGILEVYVVEK